MIRQTFYDFIGEQPPQEPHFSGSVHVLIDGGSFSTTSDICAALHRLTEAVFVGEETGGSYYGNTSGSWLTFTLPHTKARARIPLERFYGLPSGYEPLDRGLVPDHHVVPDPADLTSEGDTVLEYALSLIE